MHGSGLAGQLILGTDAVFDMQVSASRFDDDFKVVWNVEAWKPEAGSAGKFLRREVLNIQAVSLRGESRSGNCFASGKPGHEQSADSHQLAARRRFKVAPQIVSPPEQWHVIRMFEETTSASSILTAMSAAIRFASSSPSINSTTREAVQAAASEAARADNYGFKLFTHNGLGDWLFLPETPEETLSKSNGGC